MDAISFDDRLELLGVVLGGFLLLGVLGSLVGMPWATNPDLLAVLAQLVGLVLTAAVAVALLWVVRLN